MKNSFRLLAFVVLLAGCKTPEVTQQITNPDGTPPVQTQSGVRNDMRVVLHEEMLNKVFKALGNISGSGDYELLYMKNKYTWTVINPQIKLKPGKAEFVASVNVKTGPIDYTSNISGNVGITYDNKKNLINLKIAKAVFEVYTTLAGTKYHLTDIDLATYFKDPFTFDGPAGMETDFDFTMPDNSVRKIWMKPTDCNVVVEEHQIVVPCETQFYQKEK